MASNPRNTEMSPQAETSGHPSRCDKSGKKGGVDRGKQKNKKNSENHQRTKATQESPNITTTLRLRDLLEAVHVRMKLLTPKQSAPLWKTGISFLLTKLNWI